MKRPKKRYMSRFVCPKHGEYLEPQFIRGTRQRFYGCPAYKHDDCDYSVEGEPPYKAYGNVARDFDAYGVPQDAQVVPTKRYATYLNRKEAYEDILRMNFEAVSNFLLIKRLLPNIHKLGFKKTVSDVREDLETVRRLGRLPEED
jgi:hypothetical protein